MLLAWQDSSELRQLLSQLRCAGERSGRGETLPAGAEEGSRCAIPFCSLDGRDHRANAGHEGSSAPLKSHMPPRTMHPRTRVWHSTLLLAACRGTARPCAAPGASRTRLLHTAPDRGARDAEGTPRTRHSSHCTNVRNAWKIAQSTEQPVGNSLSQ